MQQSIPLAEYPRPQLTREDWLCLNGAWQMALAPGRSADETDFGEQPTAWDTEITVPYSPECKLSGVGHIVTPQEALWYRRSFTLPMQWAGKRVLLHFGAVDQTCRVWVNDIAVGGHAGGYNAFVLDITDRVHAGENSLAVAVRDVSDSSYHARGKQKLQRGGIWYTPQSGIWQTVWLECVPQSYVERLVIVPNTDEKCVDITVCAAGQDTALPVTVTFNGTAVQGTAGQVVRLPAAACTLWTPETPTLYPFTVTMGEDTVGSYFALRTFATGPDAAGTPRLLLNGKPYFHNGVLDQGYWQQGMYTPPSDQAMVDDIQYMKDLGFNMLRKHIKVEPMRWYYHCDRLGMLVWQDMPSGGGQYSPLIISTPLVLGSHLSDKHYGVFSRKSAEGREEYGRELKEMVRQLQSVPCIAMWVPFNEGWGQFDAATATALLDEEDGTRLVDHASGWYDQGAGDVKSLHVYFRKYKFKPDRAGRPVVLSEFGGYALPQKEHLFTEKDFGYKVLQSREALTKEFLRLYTEEIIPAKAQGLAAAVYTQLSDVEDEVNGFYTYDRAVKKIDPAAVQAVVSSLQAEDKA